MPDRLALIIANSQFNDPQLSRLIAPNKDAVNFRRVLENKATGGFRVKMLVDESYQRIRDEIVRLYEHRKPNDLILLYYSGHGITDDYGELYLATKDTNIKLVSAAAVEATFVRTRLDRSNSQRKVVILDCCHSGAFASGTKAVVGSNVGTKEAFARNGRGWGILTASNALEFAWEDKTKPPEARASVFTQYLVRGIESGAADLDQDGRISLQELHNYTSEQLLAHGHTTQTPKIWVGNKEGKIIIARNPHPTTGSTNLSSELQQAVVNSQAWMRKGAISRLAELLNSTNSMEAIEARRTLNRLCNDNDSSVAKAAVTALASTKYTTRVAPPRPKPERKLHPQLHPSLRVTLSGKPEIIDAGQSVRWTLTIRNNGDAYFDQVIVQRGQKRLVAPFELATDKGRRFTFERKYHSVGRKREIIEVSGIANNGETIQEISQTIITVRQTSQATSTVPQNSVREFVKTIAKINKPEQMIGCPICDTQVRARNLLNHFDKTHASDEWVSAQDLLRKAIKVQARAANFDTETHCPICDVSVSANNLVHHFDKVHKTDTNMDVEGVMRKIMSTTRAYTKRQPETYTAKPRSQTRRSIKKIPVASNATETTVKCPICQTQIKPNNLMRHFEKIHTSDGWTARKLLRETIKALAHDSSPNAMINCPICDVATSAKNLVRHFDKVHGKDTTIDIKRALEKINIVMKPSIAVLPTPEFAEGNLVGMRTHLSRNDKDHTVRLSLACALWKAGKITEAMANYALLIRAKAELPNVMADLRQAAGERPENTIVLQTLGDCYIALGLVDQALKVYNSAMNML